MMNTLNIEHRTLNSEHSRIRSRALLDSRFKVQGLKFGIPARLQGRPAFTLIELLVVIAIIGVLAGLLLPAALSVKNKATLKRVQGELGRVEQAIATYKIDKGFYPPDNRLADGRVLPHPNSLYYELTGANIQGDRQSFLAADGNELVAVAALKAAFNVDGINNAGIEGGTDDLVSKNYLQDFNTRGHARVPALGGLQILGTAIEGTFNYPTGDSFGINPFRYVSSNPTNNPETFDLWVDIVVAGKTNRISNWSDDPERLN